MCKIYNLHGVFLGTPDEVEKERNSSPELAQMNQADVFMSSPVFFTPEFPEVPQLDELHVLLEETPVNLQ